MTELDPSETYAILIAITNYRDGADEINLTSALDNITDFRQILINNLKIETSKIKMFPGGTRVDVLSHLGAIMRKEDCKNIFIYYAGHGIPGEDGQTYLSFSDMNIEDYMDTGLLINDISKKINSVAPNTNLILFLDCCFSEASLEGITLTNFFALAAASTDQAANYPLGAEFSSFYQAMKNIQKNGIDNNSKTISFGELYIELKSVLNNQDTHRALKNDLDQVTFCKNNYQAFTIPVHEDIKPLMDILFDVIKSYQYSSLDDIAKVWSFKNSNQQIYYSKLRALIFKYFPYPLGLLLKEYTVTSNAIDKAIKIKEFLDASIKFIAIVLLSQLQNECANGKYRDKYNEIIFKMTHFPAHDSGYYLDLIMGLEDFYKEKITPFLGIFLWEGLNDHFKKVDELLSKSLANFSEEDALRFEVILWNYLILIGNLISYTLVAISSVGLRHKSFDKICYTHYGSVFEGESANNYDTLLGFIDTDFYTNTHSVFLVKDIKSFLVNGIKKAENEDYINLWPFVVDVNCFDSSGNNPKIYFMIKKVYGSDGYYSYQSVERSIKEEVKIYTEIDRATETVDRQFEKFKTIWQA